MDSAEDYYLLAEKKRIMAHQRALDAVTVTKHLLLSFTATRICFEVYLAE